MPAQEIGERHREGQNKDPPGPLRPEAHGQQARRSRKQRHQRDQPADQKGHEQGKAVGIDQKGIGDPIKARNIKAESIPIAAAKGACEASVQTVRAIEPPQKEHAGNGKARPEIGRCKAQPRSEAKRDIKDGPARAAEGGDQMVKIDGRSRNFRRCGRGRCHGAERSLPAGGAVRGPASGAVFGSLRLIFRRLTRLGSASVTSISRPTG